MQGLVDSIQEEYTFEITQEVREKIMQTENLHELISETSAQDLERVDVTGRFYCKVKRLLDVLLSLRFLHLLEDVFHVGN